MQGLHRLDFNNPTVRKAFVKKNGLLGFVIVYLAHYFTSEPADFHFGMADALNDPSIELLEIIGFRGCAKSTFATLGLPLYDALEGIYNFIIVAGDTTTQTKLNIANIRFELENNERIIEDYGRTFDTANNWSENKLLLKSGTLILGRSRGQKIRGLRHRQYRPQLVIVDDPEDIEWVKTRENRDKTERWFSGEIIPAVQETKSKLILISNLLHNDCLAARVKRMGIFRVLWIPFYNKRTGEVAWKGKYPTPESVEKQKAKVKITVWSREYLLIIVAEENQVIKETDIQYYPNEILVNRDHEGKLAFKILDAGIGGDLAISEKQSADFTAFVAGLRVKWGENKHILIKPNPFKDRIDFHGTQQAAIKFGANMPMGTKWYIEDIGYQRAAIESLKRKLPGVYGIRPIKDKKARLEAVAPLVKDGTVLFPRTGCEKLIQSIINFGSETHDDDVDAFVYLLLGMVSTPQAVPIVAKVDRV